MNTPLPPDQPARDRIATELDTTMLVEAAAGTGKTTAMISRLVALLRAGWRRESSHSLQKIAAIDSDR